MSNCPKCETNNVQSHAYEPEPGEYKLVIQCNECRQTYEVDYGK